MIAQPVPPQPDGGSIAHNAAILDHNWIVRPDVAARRAARLVRELRELRAERDTLVDLCNHLEAELASLRGAVGRSGPVAP